MSFNPDDINKVVSEAFDRGLKNYIIDVEDFVNSVNMSIDIQDLFLQLLTTVNSIPSSSDTQEDSIVSYWNTALAVVDAIHINRLLARIGYSWKITQLVSNIEMSDGTYTTRAILSFTSLYDLVRPTTEPLYYYNQDQLKRIDRVHELFLQWMKARCRPTE